VTSEPERLFWVPSHWTFAADLAAALERSRARRASRTSLDASETAGSTEIATPRGGGFSSPTIPDSPKGINRYSATGKPGRPRVSRVAHRLKTRDRVRTHRAAAKLEKLVSLAPTLAPTHA